MSGTTGLYDGVLQIVHPDRVVSEADLDQLPLVEPVYPLTEGLSLNQVRRRAVACAAENSQAAGVAGRGLAASAWAFPTSPKRCTTLHRPAEPTDVLPDSPAWSRLAYDELFAGQLALALVRAHQRTLPGRGSSGEGVLRAKVVAALPYSLTPSQAPRNRRHRHRSGAPAAHGAAAARRRRLRQDRGGAAVRRDRDRGRPPGRADGADRNPGPPASRHHRAARGEGRHPRRHPDRPRARHASAARRSNGWRSARSICWSAPTRCSRTRWRSAISRSPSSTSSTASACISGWRSPARATPSTCWC